MSTASAVVRSPRGAVVRANADKYEQPGDFELEALVRDAIATGKFDPSFVDRTAPDAAEQLEYYERLCGWLAGPALESVHVKFYRIPADEIPVRPAHEAGNRNRMNPGSSTHDANLRDNIARAGGISSSAPITIVVDVWKNGQVLRAALADGNHRLAYLRMLLKEGADVSPLVPVRFVVKVLASPRVRPSEDVSEFPQ